jgi:hypothetical protein
MLIGGSNVKSMFGGREFKMDLVESVGGPSVGMRNLTWKLL